MIGMLAAAGLGLAALADGPAKRLVPPTERRRVRKKPVIIYTLKREISPGYYHEHTKVVLRVFTHCERKTLDLLDGAIDNKAGYYGGEETARRMEAFARFMIEQDHHIYLDTLRVEGDSGGHCSAYYRENAFTLEYNEARDEGGQLINAYHEPEITNFGNKRFEALVPTLKMMQKIGRKVIAVDMARYPDQYHETPKVSGRAFLNPTHVIEAIEALGGGHVGFLRKEIDGNEISELVYTKKPRRRLFTDLDPFMVMLDEGPKDKSYA